MHSSNTTYDIYNSLLCENIIIIPYKSSQVIKMENEDTVVLNEHILLQDFVESAPSEACKLLFKNSKLQLRELIDCREKEIYSLASKYSVLPQIVWNWIADWRKRNQLEYIAFVEENNIQKLESPDSSPHDLNISFGTVEVIDCIDADIEKIEHRVGTSKKKLTLLSPSHLRVLLEQTDYGKQILKHATTHKLSDAGQKLVVNTVAQFHLSLGRKTTAEIINDLSDVIICVFPKESKETYYLPKAGRSNPGGKLFSRINYIKQSERQRANKEAAHIASIIEDDSKSLELTTEEESAVQWLNQNISPWSTVLTLWEISFRARKQYLKQSNRVQQLINEYPQLQEEFGYQLLDIDYRNLGLGDPSECFKKWDTIFEPVAQYVNKNAKDPSSKRLLQGLRDASYSSDIRLLHLLHALSTVLIPVKASKGFKPTISVAQSDTFLLANSRDSGRTKLHDTLQILENLKLPASPKLVVIDESL
ncbi:uncharacterized protein LOC131439463 isoform X1 [Malaya genurostris]|uniref:uncharacterized protein LOC131439463 isoform X1 n=1 Tax=Malaya genurostris TaxID=325434 RepID=UPI0026F3E29C|nr:uncharacterized protein LOC131439463 isoform X1 [Malaya genurostris]